MNLGVSTASFYPLETEEALKEIAKGGVKNTEIFFNALCELKPAFIDLLKDITDEYGINVKAIHPTLSLAEPFAIFSSYDRRFYESLETFARYSEIAAEFGAKYIILHGGKPDLKMTDEEYCERYMALKDVTLKNCVTVLQENVVNYRAGNIEFMRSMRDILGDDAEFCFDIKQSIRCGYPPLKVVEEFKENIHHYHISDHSIAGDCFLPGKGGFDFSTLFNMLKSSDKDLSFIIEVYNNAYKDYSEIFQSYNSTLKLL